jgi:parallel beta-helix repeat protein
LNSGTSGVFCPGAGPHKRLTIIGNVIRNSALAGISVGGASYVSIIGNTIEQAGRYGIDLFPSGGGGSDKTTDSVVAGNTINACGWSGIHVAPGCERNAILRNIIKSAGSGPSPANRSGVYAEANDTSITSNVIMTGKEHGIIISGGSGRVTIIGNTIAGNDSNGVFVPSGGNDTVVERNHIYQNGQYGILLYGSGSRTLVMGNRVYSNGYTGVRLISQMNAVVSGNLIMNNGTKKPGGGDQEGLRLFNTSGAVVTGNKFGDDQGSTTQVTHIRQDGSSDFNVIVANDLTPAGTAISLSGANSKVAHNMGAATHNV